MRPKWTKSEAGAVRHYRRAQRWGSDSDYTAAQWETLVSHFGNVCLACGANDVTVDHVVPLSRGGSNTLLNLQPLCRQCNSIKGESCRDYRDVRTLVQVLEIVGL